MADAITSVIKAVDDELKQTVEVVYEPYKLDLHNQWMSIETIRKACDNFNANLENGTVHPNLFHLMPTNKFSIIKSWINEVDSTIGGNEISEGTWLVKIQYNDLNLWKQVKNGTIQGVSIGAKGKINKPKRKKNEDAEGGKKETSPSKNKPQVISED